jgi:hypothetical protein
LNAGFNGGYERCCCNGGEGEGLKDIEGLEWEAAASRFMTFDELLRVWLHDEALVLMGGVTHPGCDLGRVVPLQA